MQIVNCGTKVKMILKDVDAIITGVSIRFGNISYELSYFYGGEYKVIWANECEFTTTEKETTRVGFSNYKSVRKQK